MLLTWATIPGELQGAIASFCDAPTLACVCLLDRSWNDVGTRALYCAIDLDVSSTEDSCEQAIACAHTLRHTTKAALVHELVLRSVVQRKFNKWHIESRTRVAFTTLSVALGRLRSLQYLRILVDNERLAFLPVTGLWQDLSAAFNLRVLEVPSLSLVSEWNTVHAILRAQYSTLHILGRYGSVPEQDKALSSDALEATAMSGHAVFYRDAADERHIICYPKLYPPTYFSQYFASILRIGTPITGLTLYVLTEASIPLAIAALPPSLKDVPALAFLIARLDMPGSQDHDMVAAVLAHFPRLRYLRIDLEGEDRHLDVDMQSDQLIQLACRARERGCPDLLRLEIGNVSVSMSLRGNWEESMWKAKWFQSA
ncbi:hypothetical protein EXIGLDRAFT_728004 [Exidia glandulosa HHB12029]|uniref:F-box domain-containing protein n=1 Tax=Exidia glandulosa HHB12029 TaxID=1314781 RepID=A0A165D3P2_EXIGL|nr:hypothetical protein EXIGLDRAFT_728004 [Exidia glandulosa HHB12029]